jgi:hypothetical protein
MRLQTPPPWQTTESFSLMCDQGQRIKQLSITLMLWLSRPDFNPLQAAEREIRASILHELMLLVLRTACLSYGQLPLELS